MGTICESNRNKLFGEETVKIKEHPEINIDPTNFYDVIVSINSIIDISKKGWKIKLSERFKKNHTNFINDKTLKIGIIGNSNKGKSFILSKLSKIDLPAGTSIKTEGLSIKYPDLEIYKNRRITLLDSAGLETPVLKEEFERESNSLNKQQPDEKENTLIKDEKPKIENSITGQLQKDENESEIFKEKSREKIITEKFLQNYIIHNSDILLVVVGILTYSEQKLLNKIRIITKNGLLNKPNNSLYIIHNLMTYNTVEQVQFYIKETLLKSATFELEENLKINIKTVSQNGVCYFEKNSDTTIYHLIFANDFSEAGKFYNRYTLQFIENLFEANINLKGFDVLGTIQERFKEFSKDVFENFPGEIEFYNSPHLIKLKNPKELILKQFFIDELGFSNMREKGFEPNYNYYKTKNHIIQSGEYVIIKISGTKENEDNQENIESNFNNGRKFGNFSLTIPLKQEGFIIKNEQTKIEKNDGIFILSFTKEKIKTVGVFLHKKK